jgi:uncharacterized protein (TIGR00299 family) protein
VECAHGTLPVPVPAVVKMLEGTDIALKFRDIDTELITPTGMGILKCCAESFGPMPEMSLEATGYGFGKKDTGSLNALRVMVGNIEESETQNGIFLVETNIDNTTGEELGFAMEQLLTGGALDVWYTPVQMKKNRPGVMLSVICAEERLEEIAEVIFTNTDTIGVRYRKISRFEKERRFDTVVTEYGAVNVKVTTWNGKLLCTPEYEDCKKVALENGVSLGKVREAAKESFSDAKT